MADARRLGCVRHHRHDGTIVGGRLMLQQCKRVWQVLPSERLLMECQNVDAFALVDRGKDDIQVGTGCDGGKIPIPYRHVEGSMLAAHEVGAAKAPALLEGEREQ